MKKIYLIAVLLLSITASVYSQYRKNVYAEVLGNGVLFSANFDMRFKKDQNDGLGFRAGIGGGSIPGSVISFEEMDGSEFLPEIKFDRSTIITIPLSINYVFGKKRSGFETGLGTTFIFADTKIGTTNDLVPVKGFGVTGFLNAGYRFQPLEHGVYFHVKWTPAINANGFIADFFGLGLGYSFR